MLRHDIIENSLARLMMTTLVEQVEPCTVGVW